MDQRKVVGFLAYWVITAVTLLVATQIFKGNVVLGTKDVSAPLAAVLAGLVINVLLYFVEPLIAKSDIKSNLKTLKLKDEHLMGLIYLGANIVILWVVKWFAAVLGLGISSLVYVVLLGILLTLTQWATFKFMPAIGASKK